MRVALICTDKPGHLDVRKANREAHLAHIRDTGVVEMAGPLLGTGGEMEGSLVILDVPDLAAAEGDTILDAFVFARAEAAITDVWSAGRHLVTSGRHIARDRITARYGAVIRRLTDRL